MGLQKVYMTYIFLTLNLVEQYNLNFSPRLLARQTCLRISNIYYIEDIQQLAFSRIFAARRYGTNLKMNLFALAYY